MKTLLAGMLLIGLAATSTMAQTNATKSTQSATETPRRRNFGGPDIPPATNELSWKGVATNAAGNFVAKIVVDTSEAPELAAWGAHAGELCEEWYPKIAVILGVDSFLNTNKTIRIWFRKEMSGDVPAFTNPGSGLMSLRISYVKDHTNDFGMVIHELVHTVQSFGGRGGPSATFSESDIKDLPAFAEKLKEHHDPVSEYLWGQFSEAAQKQLTAYSGKDAENKTLSEALAKELSEIARTNGIYQEARFAGITLSEQAKSMAEEGPQGPRLTRFNRMLIEEAYPTEIAKNGRGSRSGGGRGGGNRSGGTTWLTEGIADYVRLGHFEPEARLPRINPDTANYTDSYKTTATFLRWVEKNYDKEFVKKINLALRGGTYNLDLFKEYTGKTADELWKEFAEAIRAKQKLV